MATATGSDFNVEVVRVVGSRKHPNADRLSVVTVNGAETVFKTEDFKEGDLAIYVPVDAMVPLAHKDFAFLASKSKPERTHARIRAMKLRGVYSEGMLVPCRLPYPEGANVQAALGISKHETKADIAERGPAPVANSKRTLAKKFNALVPIYQVDALKRMEYTVPVGEAFLLTEKIHGSNARFAYIDGHFYVGSHRVLRSVSSHRIIEWFKRTWINLVYGAKGYYAETLGDIWLQVANNYNLEAICRDKLPGLVVYGEIYGKGVQTRGGVDFVYDKPEGLGFIVFDLYDAKRKMFLSYDAMSFTCGLVGLPVVPFMGMATHHPELGMSLSQRGLESGRSQIGNHIREGVVARNDFAAENKDRKVLKLVSPAYKMLENEAD